MKSTPFLVAVIIIILGVVGFSYYQNRASSTIANKEEVIASLESQATSLGNQLTSANTQITELQTQVIADSTQITSLQNDLNTVNAQASSLQSQLTSANDQITSLQSQLSSVSSQADSLQAQLGTSNSQISSLQIQLDAANARITTMETEKTNLQNIVNLSLSTSVSSLDSFSQSAGAETLIGYFTADYTGYVYVTGTSTTATGYVRVIGYYGGYYYTGYNYSFGTGNTVVMPVLPGTVYIYFGNTDLSGAPSADISIAYYY
jgi:uncharacterized coiled-coil DUF342 family protein